MSRMPSTYIPGFLLPIKPRFIATPNSGMDTSRGSVNCCEFGLVTHIVNGLGNNFAAGGVVVVV